MFPFDDAGHPDADAEQTARVGAGVGEDVRHGRPHMGHDALDVVTVLGQRPFGAGEFGQGEVEQLDAHPGFADVDPDQQTAPGSDAEQRAGTAAVGVDDARLLEDSLRDQFGDDVADGTRTQPRGRCELLAAQRPVEIQPLQNPRPVAPPQVTHGPSVALGHVAPSFPQHTPAQSLDATFLQLLDHDIN